MLFNHILFESKPASLKFFAHLKFYRSLNSKANDDNTDLLLKFFVFLGGGGSLAPTNTLNIAMSNS